MNDLLLSCTEDLPQPPTPVCANDYGERITQVILSKTIVEAAGNVPTPNEFAAAFEENVITLIKGIVRGHRMFLSNTEIEWHNKEYFDPIYRVDGRISRVDESIARACERLTRYTELYLYYITEKNYCFGYYKASTDFSSILYDGKGTPVGINFALDYVGNGIDYSNYDANYEDVLGNRYIIYGAAGAISYGTAGIIIY